MIHEQPSTVFHVNEIVIRLEFAIQCLFDFTFKLDLKDTEIMLTFFIMIYTHLLHLYSYIHFWIIGVEVTNIDRHCVEILYFLLFNPKTLFNQSNSCIVILSISK